MTGRGSHGAVLAVSGLMTESRIAAASGVVTVAGGGDAQWLASAIERHVAEGASALISFGIAGALLAGLEPGALIVGRSVWANGTERFETDIAWSQALRSAIPAAIAADLAGSDTVVATSAGKAELGRESGAVAVDMESHVAARIAAKHGLPFAALRAIADPVERSVPPAAAAAMLPGGQVAAHKAVLALLRDPAQLHGMLHVARDARRALRALARGRRRLGDCFGRVDLDQLALHVV